MAKNKRSDTVTCAIRRSYAKLAQVHFEIAEKTIRDHLCCAEVSNPGLRADKHMQKVEQYLDKAGADATKYYFR